MSIEGGGRYSAEDPYLKGIEVCGDHRIEDDQERENSSWLSTFVSPEMIDRAREYPAHEKSSTEWLIYQRLLGVLVETGPELDPVIRKRLRNLVGVFRMAMFSNLNPWEQDSVMQWSKATTFDTSALEYTINQEAVEDIQWTWRTFELQVPTPEQQHALFGESADPLFRHLPQTSAE